MVYIKHNPPSFGLLRVNLMFGLKLLFTMEKHNFTGNSSRLNRNGRSSSVFWGRIPFTRSVAIKDYARTNETNERNIYLNVEMLTKRLTSDYR